MQRAALRTLCCLLLAGAAAACVQPPAVELFVPSSRAQDGLYSFELDLEGAPARYDLSLFTRSDLLHFGPSEPLQLEVRWFSPDSVLTLSERVWMPLGGIRGWTGPYRTGIQAESAGTWRLELKPLGGAGHIRGLGLVCTNTLKAHGTR